MSPIGLAGITRILRLSVITSNGGWRNRHGNEKKSGGNPEWNPSFQRRLESSSFKRLHRNWIPAGAGKTSKALCGILGSRRHSRLESAGWNPVLTTIAQELDPSLRWDDEQRRRS